MSGTKQGGRQAAETNKRKYGDDFYSRIGAAGGKRSIGGGFASHEIGRDGLTGPQRASVVGALGGRKSRRGKAV